MNWDQIVTKVTPHIVKIETQAGYGTGFLSLYNETKTLCGVATASHVVEDAANWQQPIRILHHTSNETIFLPDSDRFIIKNPKTDSAVILFAKGKFSFPEDPIPLFPSDSILDIGVEVAWLGFPAVSHDNLCFFSGNISAKQEKRNAYLIDGVAINGVSGGPVLYATSVEGIQIVGTVSAYHANRRATGEVLPGLLIAQDVSHFHDVASRVQSIDDANKKKVELEESQQEYPIDGEESEENNVAPPKQPPQDRHRAPEHKPPQETHANKKGQTRLRVTMSDQTEISHHRASDTFCDVLKRFGLEDVHEIEPRIVSKSPFLHGKYKEVDGYWINVNNGTKPKKRILDRIAQRLGISITVEIIMK